MTPHTKVLLWPLQSFPPVLLPNGPEMNTKQEMTTYHVQGNKTNLFRPLERYDWHLAPPHQNENENMATKLQGKILKHFVDSLLSSTFEIAFSVLAILTHFVIFLFIAHFLFWVKIGDQGACAGVYWIWGAQYVKISPEITQFCNFSISDLRFNLLKRENIQKHCFQSNLAESLKIAGNIFSCSPPPTHSPSQVSKSSKLVTICEREALQMVSDAWNTLSKLLYQYTFPLICCQKQNKYEQGPKWSILFQILCFPYMNSKAWNSSTITEEEMNM